MNDKNRPFPYAAFSVVIAFLAGALWLILDAIRNKNQTGGKHYNGESADFLLPEVPVEVVPPSQDDLTKIDGIGPKVSSVLAAAGVRTYEQLADTPALALKDILMRSGNRISDPQTWPEQAALAAKGAWEKLKSLQAELKGGRRPA